MQQSRAEQIQVSPQVCETVLCKFFPFYITSIINYFQHTKHTGYFLCIQMNVVAS